MESANDKELDQLLNEHFAGRVVRKDLTKLIKEGANVPVYVLEYLLGMYCASDDPEIIEQGLRNVKTVLAENYVRPDEAEKVKSLVRERGSYKVIDRQYDLDIHNPNKVEYVHEYTTLELMSLLDESFTKSQDLLCQLKEAVK